MTINPGIPCRHDTLLARIKIPVNEYVCDDCKVKLVLVIPQYGLMTPEEFEQFKRVQAMQIQNAKRRKSTGLVTPSEARQAEEVEKIRKFQAEQKVQHQLDHAVFKEGKR